MYVRSMTRCWAKKNPDGQFPGVAPFLNVGTQYQMNIKIDVDWKRISYQFIILNRSKIVHGNVLWK